MSQFLRPDGNVTQTNFTNGFANIDEAVASDADFAYGTNNTAAVLEVSLGDPTGTPASGTCTVRYRIAKTNAGTVDGTGNAVTVTGAVYQGAAQIATDSARTATGTWTEYAFTFNTSAVSDWTDLRLRFTTSSSGGNPSNRRGGAVSWAVLETPDAAVVTYKDATLDFTGSGTTALSRGRLRMRALATTAAATVASTWGRIRMRVAGWASAAVQLVSRGRQRTRAVPEATSAAVFAVTGGIEGTAPAPAPAPGNGNGNGYGPGCRPVRVSRLPTTRARRTTAHRISVHRW